VRRKFEFLVFRRLNLVCSEKTLCLKDIAGREIGSDSVQIERAVKPVEQFVLFMDTSRIQQELLSSEP
jgi:hypothetical protein